MSDALINITKQNFWKTVIRSPVPVVLVLWSEEYESCRRLCKTIRELAAQYHKSIRVGSIDVDNQPELSRRLCIGGLPCILILRGGRICENIGGELPLSHYKRLIDKILENPVETGEVKNKKQIPKAGRGLRYLF